MHSAVKFIRRCPPIFSVESAVEMWMGLIESSIHPDMGRDLIVELRRCRTESMTLNDAHTVSK